MATSPLINPPSPAILLSATVVVEKGEASPIYNTVNYTSITQPLPEILLPPMAEASTTVILILILVVTSLSPTPPSQAILLTMAVAVFLTKAPLPSPIPPSQAILLTTKAAAFSVPEPESEQLPIPHFLGIIQPPKTVAASITLAPSTLPTPSSPIAPVGVITQVVVP